MLRLERRDIEYECGGQVRHGEHVPLRSDLHLDKIASLLENERELAIDYGGWWFFATSTRLLRSVGLPLPFFLKYDDAEFGCRLSSKAPLLTFNGIGVWHESFDRKDVQLAGFYFYPRNRLVFQAIRHEESSLSGYVFGFVKLLASMVRGTAEYRYRNVRLVHAAVTDFLRGPDYVFCMDMKHRLEELSEHTYPVGPIAISENERTALARFEDRAEEGVFQKVLGLAAVCGHLWPSLSRESKVVVPICPPPGSIFGRRKVVVYDRQRGTGVELRRSLRACAAALWHSLTTLLLLIFFWRGVRRKYLKGWQYYATEDFWRRRLGPQPADAGVASTTSDPEHASVVRRPTEAGTNV